MTGIFYGSTTGNTETLAEQIAKKLGVASSDTLNVGSASADEADKYDCILLGSSTWGQGEMQDDWYDFIVKLKSKDMKGKKVALFGCGDSSSYPDTFCDAIGLIHKELESTGCQLTGEVDDAGYTVRDSLAFSNGRAKGLLIDDDQPDLTEERINKWIEIIKNS